MLKKARIVLLLVAFATAVSSIWWYPLLTKTAEPSGIVFCENGTNIEFSGVAASGWSILNGCDNIHHIDSNVPLAFWYEDSGSIWMFFGSDMTPTGKPQQVCKDGRKIRFKEKLPEGCSINHEVAWEGVITPMDEGYYLLPLPYPE